MKLEKFKEKNHKKIGIIMFTLSCILLITIAFFYHSFASYNVFKDFNVIHGNVEDPGDLSFAYYVDDQITHDVPTKDSGYTLSSKSICTNGVKVSWDEENWIAIVNYSDYQKNLSSKVKCNLFFEERKPKLTDYITMLSSTDSTQLKYDETVDNNLRYIGKDPNNYVSFNHELWRIIGVMNHIDDGTGKKESRVKLIRDESIGLYSWDKTENTINGGRGVNEWSTSKISFLLNDSYYNRKTTTCYSNEVIACDFSTLGIQEDAKDLIGNTLWYTGTKNNEDYSDEESRKVSSFYSYERSNFGGKICDPASSPTTEVSCNDTVDRTTTWIGKIGLFYLSDYGYATSGGDTSSRVTCLNTGILNWENDCVVNNWLFKENKFLWTMTSAVSSEMAVLVWNIDNEGHQNFSDAYANLNIYPTLYLKENVKIVSGEGSRENPFIIKN